MGGVGTWHSQISIVIPYYIYNKNIREKSSGCFFSNVTFLIVPLSQKITLKNQFQLGPPGIGIWAVNRSYREHFFFRIPRQNLGSLANFHFKQTFPGENFGIDDPQNGQLKTL